MSKYINADELVEQLEIFRDTKKKTKYAQGVNATIDAAKMVIHNLTLGEEKTSMPSADVVEVKHGEWTEEYIEEEDPLFRRRWLCSACGDWNSHGKTPFCPYCGADMRERKETE